MKTSFVCAPFAENDDGIYYHGFKVQGKVFSALNYCAFKESTSGETFFGKIQSIFHDKKTNLPMAEVSVFQFTPSDQKRTDSVEYNELWAVMNQTMEIPLSSIQNKEVALCHVPPEVNDKDLIDYVHKNIGKKEHDEAKDSDDEEEEDDMEDFIVNGDIMGFYQYGVTDDDELCYAPPPQFADKYLSFQTSDVEDKIEHEFSYYIAYEFILPQIKKHIIHNEPALNPEMVLDCFYTQQYAITDNKFYIEIAEGQLQVNCDIDDARKMTAFVFLLKTMLTNEEVPKLTDMYDFCLKFKLGV